MILESLSALARREGLVDQPAFQSVPVRWIIDVDEQGQFRGELTDTAYTVQDEGKRKPRQEFKRMSVPRRTVRPGQVTKPEFLVDNAQYVLGIQPEGAKAKKIPMETYRRSFLDLLRTAQAIVDSPVLNAAIAFLENDEQRGKAAADLQARKFGSGDWITFRLRGEFIHEASEACDWWAKQRDDSSDDLKETQCLVCGQVKPSARIHDKLTLEGTGTFGAPLVGFNKEAFEKHGLSGNENAPVCRTCMVAYVNALRRCLDDKFPRRKGGTFPQQSVRLSKDTTAVYWDDQSSELTGALWWLNNENPSVVKHILESGWKGERPAFSNARFYCLILTGAEGRAVVRGMHISTVEKLSKHVESYFNCIESVSPDGRPAPIYELLRSLVRKSDQKEHRKHLQPWLAAEVFLAAVLGKPLSEQFIAAAVGRNRTERKVTWPRAALIHLYFQRHSNQEMRKVPMSLDVNSPSPPYRYGRLLAVLESLQFSAHKKRVNSTIVDRFYGAASTRPATVFPMLLQLAQNHLKQSSASRFYKDEIAEIIQGLDGDKGFAPMLNIKDQGVFALGYFHQVATRPKSSKAGNASNEESTGSEENQA
jgi:CRISPR-associated protein Csd1